MKNIINIFIIIRDFIKQYKYILFSIVLLIIALTLIKKCENKNDVFVKTKTVIKTDTIYKTIISPPKIVYVNKYVDKQGEKAIVYLEKPTDSTTIKANQYNTTLISNNATSKLKITTTGELLDVTGFTTYPEVTKTVTKTDAKSGLFLYGSAPLNTNNLNIEVGLMYQFKNTLMLSGGVQYNDFIKTAEFKIGLGIKIF